MSNFVNETFLVWKKEKKNIEVCFLVTDEKSSLD